PGMVATRLLASCSRCRAAVAMMRSRCRITGPPAVTITPLFGNRANSATPRSISPALRTPIGVNSTPRDGATDWMAPHWPVPPGSAASRMIAARVTPGASSLSSSSHFPPILYSVNRKPVALPPRQAVDDAGGGDRVADVREHEGHGAGGLLQCLNAW